MCCLISIRKTLTCARASKVTKTNMPIARTRCESQTAVGWMLAQLRDALSRSSLFKFILDKSIGLWADIQSAGECVSRTHGFESWFHHRFRQNKQKTNMYVWVSEPATDALCFEPYICQANCLLVVGMYCTDPRLLGNLVVRWLPR